LRYSQNIGRKEKKKKKGKIKIVIETDKMFLVL